MAVDFAENALSWVRQIRVTGQVREPYPTAAGVPIAMDDIAAGAAGVLLADDPARGITSRSRSTVCLWSCARDRRPRVAQQAASDAAIPANTARAALTLA